MDFQDLYNVAKFELERITEEEQSDFRLEQAVFDEEDETWEVIMSYLVENINQPVNALTAVAGRQPFERVFKKVIIDNKEKVKGFYIYNH